MPFTFQFIDMKKHSLRRWLFTILQVTDVTEGDMHYYYEAFHEFDKHAEGYISASELGSLMRALGENPTSMELEVWMWRVWNI